MAKPDRQTSDRPSAGSKSGQKQEATRFSKARLSRSTNTKEREVQNKARERLKKRRRALESRAARLTIPVFMRKFSELLMISTIIGAVISYNLQLPQGLYINFIEWIRSANGGSLPGPGDSMILRGIADFRFLFSSGMPVLEIKTTIFLFFAVGAVGVHLLARLFEAITKTPVFLEDPHAKTRKGIDQRRLFVLIAAMGFLAWSFISFSIFGWGPNLPFLSDDTDYIGSAGSYNAIIAWFQVLGAVIFLISAEDMIRTRRMVYKILGMIFGLGVLATCISLMIHTDLAIFKPITQFLVQWGESEYRNDVGGIIGHNTAISSFLIAPFLIGWTLFMLQKDKASWLSLSLVVFLCMMSLVLLMAQSRAVIPILGFCIAWTVWLQLRRASLKIPMPILVGAPLLVIVLILSQVVESNMNPFYRDNVTLEQRASHLTFDHLRTETRFRIASAIIPEIRDNVLIGTGFHSFPIVYTDAQAEYFSGDTDFFFAPTGKRTARAHSEYLQTVLETGIIGLALALMAVGGIIFGGWQVLTRSLRQPHVAIQVAIIASIAGYMLHGLFDFPFRIAPLYSVLILLLAIWSAGDRLWNIRVPDLADRPLNDSEAEKQFLAQIEAEKNRKLSRPLVGIWGLMGVGIATLLLILGINGSNWFVNPLLNLRGTQQIARLSASRSGAPEERLDFLNSAEVDLENAQRLAPLMGETKFLLAQINQNKTIEYNRMAQQIRQAGSIDRALFLEGQAVNEINKGLANVQASLPEHYFFGSYRMMSLLQYSKFLIDRTKTEHMLSAISTMQISVDLNPGDIDGIRTLISWIETYQPGNRDQLVRLYRRRQTFFPHLLEEETIPYLNYQIGAGENQEAAKKLIVLREAVPENLTLKFMEIAVNLYEGKTEETRRLSNSISRDNNPFWRILNAQIAIRQGNFKDAENRLSEEDQNESNNVKLQRRRLQLLLRAKMNNSDIPFEVAIIDQIRLETSLSHRDMVNLAIQAEFIFNDQEAAFRIAHYALVKAEDLNDIDYPDKLYIGRLFREYRKDDIEAVRKAQAAAQAKNLPMEEWPGVEPGEARDDLIIALELEGSTWQFFSENESPKTNQITTFLRPQLFQLKRYLVPGQ